MIIAMLRTVYLISAAVAFVLIFASIGNVEGLGFVKYSSKPEHPSETMKRLFLNCVVVIVGAIFFPLLLFYFYMRWWNERANEYNAAKGNTKKLHVNGYCSIEPLTFNELDKPIDEETTFSNTLKERYIQAIAEGDWELVEQLDYEWNMRDD